ncbi:MAG: right-handed parallel beta-helix repeat-containing protein [Rhodothermales bacterium]
MMHRFLLILLLALLPGIDAFADTFTVNTTADHDDGRCELRRSGDCTLREAIQAAIDTPGAHTIAFNIPGGGPHTIVLSSELPRLPEDLLIDGYTQRNAAPATATTPADIRIELSGGGAVPYGLRLDYFVEVRGLSIISFAEAGIESTAPRDDVTVSGCFVGLRADGTTPAGNQHGVSFSSLEASRIGGTPPAMRNVISGNDVGVYVRYGNNTLIEGNYIGTDTSGTRAVPNRIGIHFAEGSEDLFNNITGNVIAGNDAEGIYADRAPSLDITGNAIGVDASGNPLGNGGDGILLYEAQNARLSGNTIAHNRGDGIRVLVEDGGAEAGTATIRENRIFENEGLGIDLNGDGVTYNDLLDADDGPNALQNYPLLNAAFHLPRSGGPAEFESIDGTLNSTPEEDFRIDVYASRTCDLSRHGEGQQYLGTVEATTDRRGNAAFSLGLTEPLDPPYRFITATATGEEGGTSEFSRCLTVPLGIEAPPPTPCRPFFENFGPSLPIGFIGEPLGFGLRLCEPFFKEFPSPISGLPFRTEIAFRTEWVERFEAETDKEGFAHVSFAAEKPGLYLVTLLAADPSVKEPFIAQFEIPFYSKDDLWNAEAASEVAQTAGPADVQAEATEVPAAFALEANWPNPFNPATTIAFALPEASDVRLVVYDVMGREVARLADGPMAAGRHEVAFEAGRLPSGTYLYRIEAGDFSAVQRMTLVK